MMPAYMKNRFYAIFFITFTVIGKYTKTRLFFVVNLFGTISVFNASKDGLDGELESQLSNNFSAISQVWNTCKFCRSDCKLNSTRHVSPHSTLHARHIWIWKRKFHSQNASNVFRAHSAGGITGHLGFVFEENSATWWSWRQGHFSKCLPFTRQRKAGVFKFLRFVERFRKAPFSRRITADGRPDNKVASSNSSG